MTDLLIARGTKFIDIDGTILHTETEEPLGNVVSIINKWYDEGHVIVLTTLRGDLFKFPHRLSKGMTESMLRRIGLKYHHILYNCPSPRVVINDDGAEAINHETNKEWEENK